MANNSNSYDPWDSAWNAQPRVYSNEVYGEVSIVMEPVVLIKGVGKVTFDPSAHKEEDRRTSITVNVTPLPESKFKETVSRDTLAESNDWTKITLPSVKAVGLTGMRELNGKYVHVKLIPTGAKFTDKNGVEREKTAFSFLTVFSNEQECRAAFHANENDDNSQEAEPAPVSNGPTNGDNGQETALKFLPPIVENCCKGAASKDEAKVKVAMTIASMPPVSKYFAVDSPEVVALIDKFMGG